MEIVQNGYAGNAKISTKSADLSGTGSGELIAAVTGKKIRILGVQISLSASARCQIHFTTTAAGNKIVDVTGTSIVALWDSWFLQGGAAESVRVTLPGSQTYTGVIHYAEVQ